MYGTPTLANLMICPAIRPLYPLNSHRTGGLLDPIDPSTAVVLEDEPAPPPATVVVVNAIADVDMDDATCGSITLRASMFQTWLPLDFCFLPSSLNREMYLCFHR